MGTRDDEYDYLFKGEAGVPSLESSSGPTFPGDRCPEAGLPPPLLSV